MIPRPLQKLGGDSLLMSTVPRCLWAQLMVYKSCKTKIAKFGIEIWIQHDIAGFYIFVHRIFFSIFMQV